MTLLIPGLFGLADPIDSPSSLPATPALETVLARADAIRGPGGDLETQIFTLFGIEASADADLPVAAVTRALDLGVIDKGWWLRADPVHLQPERDRLVLLDAQAVPLTQDEATRLSAELIEAYGEKGWLLKAPRPGRWYFKPPRAARIQTTPLSRVVGKDIHPYLPQGKDARTWRTLLNEMQILLHTASVNAERESRGELPINSLWFWGGGRLPTFNAVEWVEIHSDEPASLALARLSEVPSSGRPQSFADWERQAQRPGPHLAILDGARAAVQYGDPAQWAAFVERLDREWIAPLLEAVRHGVVESVTLYADNSGGFLLGRGQARRWWRRRRALSAYR